MTAPEGRHHREPLVQRPGSRSQRHEAAVEVSIAMMKWVSRRCSWARPLQEAAVFKTGHVIGLTCMIPASRVDLGTYSA